MTDRYERIRAQRDELAARLAAAQQQPAEQHPDDAAVDRFAAAMKAKLKKKRQEGRGGWQSMTAEQLSALLHEHVRKGDPVDVANLAMMLHQNGQVIELPEPPVTVVTDEMAEAQAKEFAHRPGPWHVSEHTEGSWALIYDADGFEVARVCYPNRNADAKLIAAAPELLRALIFLVNAHEHPAASSGRRGVLEYVPVALDHARAAIARATGQEG